MIRPYLNWGSEDRRCTDWKSLLRQMCDFGMYKLSAVTWTCFIVTQNVYQVKCILISSCFSRTCKLNCCVMKEIIKVMWGKHLSVLLCNYQSCTRSPGCSNMTLLMTVMVNVIEKTNLKQAKSKQINQKAALASLSFFIRNLLYCHNAPVWLISLPTCTHSTGMNHYEAMPNVPSVLPSLSLSLSVCSPLTHSHTWVWIPTLILNLSGITAGMPAMFFQLMKEWRKTNRGAKLKEWKDWEKKTLRERRK